MRIAILLAVMLAMSGPASAVVGDLNRDGVVNLKDFFIFSDNFGETGQPDASNCTEPLPIDGASGTHGLGSYGVHKPSARPTREEVEFPNGDGERLSELLARYPVVRVRSRLLGEVVVWVADTTEVPEDTGEVVYRETELRRMVGMGPTEVRAIHETKRTFDGELVE
jgi:hypothetical protein